jgi:hypothetical protein
MFFISHRFDCLKSWAWKIKLFSLTFSEWVIKVSIYFCKAWNTVMVAETQKIVRFNKNFSILTILWRSYVSRYYIFKAQWSFIHMKSMLIETNTNRKMLFFPYFWCTQYLTRHIWYDIPTWVSQEIRQLKVYVEYRIQSYDPLILIAPALSNFTTQQVGSLCSAFRLQKYCCKNTVVFYNSSVVVWNAAVL